MDEGDGEEEEEEEEEENEEEKDEEEEEEAEEKRSRRRRERLRMRRKSLLFLLGFLISCLALAWPVFNDASQSVQKYSAPNVCSMRALKPNENLWLNALA